MSSGFELDFSKAIREVTELNQGVSKVGKALDTLAADAEKSSQAILKASQSSVRAYDKLIDKQSQETEGSARQIQMYQQMRIAAEQAYASIMMSNQKAQVVAEAYRRTGSDINKMQMDTNSQQRYAAAMKSITGAVESLRLEQVKIKQQTQLLNTEEGKAVQTAKIRQRTMTHLTTSTERMKAENTRLRASLAEVNSETGKANAVLKEQIKSSEQLNTVEARITTTRERLAKELALLNNTEHKNNEINRIKLDSARKLITAEAEQEARLERTRKAVELYNSEVGKQLRQEQQRLDSLKRLTDAERQLETFQQKKTAEVAKLRQELEYLNTTEAKEAVQLKENIRLKQAELKASTETTRSANAEAAAKEKLLAANQKMNANNKILLDGKLKIQTMDAKQVVTEAELRKQIELANTSRGKTITSLKQELASLKSLAVVQAEDVKFKLKQQEAAARLRRELDHLRSAEGRAAVALQQQIAAERRAIVASTSAQAEKNRQLRVGNQLTSAMRATLQGLQSSIGMYTSSTIIAAAAAYSLSRAIRSTIMVGAEFQATMVRTQAIMGNTIHTKAQGAAFSAMSDQIRALGKSTQFTATEVASAMTELGQAGLTAGEAMTALKPTLDLAIIGQLEMARAADHSTNIMMAFGKEAKDIRNIVDVMASSVTNSNTNIDQLANSLTYAGPAAHTLGISLEETVAAVSALANAGFKASRSGTALRRVFVNLASPTEKGQKVIEQLGISVTDLEGKTNSLSAILQQLKRGFDGISETDKLAALKDLFGVYAASPVAALIEQVETFENLNNIMASTGGTAAKMRDQIEDALKFDAKTALSAFQEAQLHVFDGVQDRLQNLTMATAEWLSSLTVPLKGEDGTIALLDIYLERMKAISQSAVVLLGVWGSKRLQSSTEGLVNSLANANTSMKKFSDSTKLGLVNAKALQTSMLATGTTGKAVSASYLAAAHSMRAFGVAAQFTTKILHGLSIGLNFVMKSLGWLGMLYSAYTTFTAFFGDSSLNKVRAKRAEVDELAKSYAKMKTNLQEAAEAESKIATDKQVGAMKASLKYMEQDLAAWESIRDKSVGLGFDTSRADSEIRVLKNLVEDTKKTISNLGDTAKKEAESVVSDVTKLGDVLGQIMVQEFFISDVFKGERKKEAEVLLESLKKQFKELQSTATTAQKSIAEVFESYDKFKAESRAETLELVSKENLDDVQKHIVLLNELTAAQDRHNAARKALEEIQGEDTDKFLRQAHIDEFHNATRLVEKAHRAVEVSKKNLTDYAEITRKTDKEIEMLSMREVERFALISTELASVTAQRISNDKLLESSVISEAARLAIQKDQSELSKRELDLTKQKLAFENKSQKQTKDWKSLISGLRKEHKSTKVATEELALSEEILGEMLKQQPETIEEYRWALEILRGQLHDVRVANDEVLQGAISLRTEYLKSPYEKQAEDLIRLERALKAKVMTEEEHLLVLNKINKANEIQVERYQMAQNYGDSPFQGFTDAVVSYGGLQATNQGKIDTNVEDYLSSDALSRAEQEAEIRRDMEAKNLEDREEYERQYTAIREAGEQKRMVMAQTFASSQSKLMQAAEMERKNSSLMVLAAMADNLSSIMGMVADAGEESTASQRRAFIAQKALAVASIIVQTHVAAAMVQGQAGIGGIPLAAFVLANGYASAALVGGMAIGEYRQGKKDRKSASSSGEYAGAYDKGGYIPDGKFGIVGEYGPEIVNGPAHVTGREATARKMGGGGGNITIAPSINVEYTSEGGGNSQTSAEDARAMGGIIKAIVVDTIRNELRPNGLLQRVK